MCTCVSHVIDGCVPGSRPVPFIVCQDDLDRGDAVPVHRRVSVCMDVRACHARRHVCGHMPGQVSGHVPGHAYRHVCRHL